MLPCFFSLRTDRVGGTRVEWVERAERVEQVEQVEQVEPVERVGQVYKPSLMIVMCSVHV